MSTIKQLQVANYCYALVAGMFADFQNPTMRGANFTWDKFPIIVANLAEAP